MLVNLTSKLLEQVYFNPDRTENYVFYVTNIKDKKVLVYDNHETGWEIAVGKANIEKYIVKMLDYVHLEVAEIFV